MTDVKARYVGPSPDGVTLGVVLEDGDIHPYHVPHGGELPKELGGRKVSVAYRDGLLAQEDNWSKVQRQTTPSTSTSAKDGEK